MRSYASIDRIEGKFVVCEVEVYLVEESRRSGIELSDTVMVDIPLQKILEEVGTVQEGDILIVEYDSEDVTTIYCKDEEEKARRLELLRDVIK